MIVEIAPPRATACKLVEKAALPSPVHCPGRTDKVITTAF